MKIDLHVHASERSGCSISSEEEIIAMAKTRGLNAIAFTDHERLVPTARLAELNRLHSPFRIFSGIEIHTAEEEDILVFGIQDQKLESMTWPYADLHRFVRARNGFMVLAHPYRYRETINVDIARYRPDALEARSSNIRPQITPRILQAAETLSCAILFASDTHNARDIGTFHIELETEAESDQALVSLLRARRFSCRTLQATS